MTRFNLDLSALRQVVRTQTLRLKQRGNTWPKAEAAGPLPAPEFKATKARLEMAPIYINRGGEWRGREKMRGGYEERNRRGKGERGRGVWQENGRGRIDRKGGAGWSTNSFKTTRFPLTRRLRGVAKFEHGGEKRGGDARKEGRAGREAFNTRAEGEGAYSIFMHGRSHMTIDPGIPTMPGRSMSTMPGRSMSGPSPTRQTLLARSAKNSEVFGEVT